MMSWLSGHWVTVLVVIFAVFLGRSLFRGAAHWMRLSDGRNSGMAYCNQCGWKGSVRRTDRVCGKCGSAKLTLQTS